MGGSAKNMVFSVLAVFGIALAWWALMPQPQEPQRLPVDVEPVASYASSQSPWPVWVPQDLPEGWAATWVRYEPHTDGVLSWRIGYLSGDGEFVGIDQGAEVSDNWVASLVRGGQADGAVTIEGPTGEQQWDRYVTEDQNALVLPGTGPDEATTIVRGTASLQELQEFIGYLEPWEATHG